MSRQARKVWTTDRRTGEPIQRETTVFDVRYRVDGFAFRYRFDQRGWADDFARRLQEGFVKGWLFDPQARQFVEPHLRPDGAEAPTFYEHAQEYVHRKWRHWGPATRRNTQRELARACLVLVQDEAPQLSKSERREADAYLRETGLTPAPAPSSEEHQRWAAWFARWSLPLTEVTDQHLHRLLEEVRTTALDGTARRLAPSSLRRTRAVVRAAFTNARKRRLIDWDPWDAVETEPQQDRQVNPDLVMDPSQVRAMAQACATINDRYEVFILVQGLCGVRPGEAVALRRRDLRRSKGRLATVQVRGTHSDAPQRFLTDGETRRRPLKGRGERAGRAVPIPDELVSMLTRHLEEYVAAEPDAPVFTSASGTPITLSNFHRDVWATARNTVFPTGDPLRDVRLHDLRHAAITAWLHAGVPLKTAQTWSGHKTASVLLDTYLGIMKSDDELALRRFETLLQGDQDDDR